MMTDMCSGLPEHEKFEGEGETHEYADQGSVDPQHYAPFSAGLDGLRVFQTDGADRMLNSRRERRRRR
jgi:hypothetical protein